MVARNHDHFELAFLAADAPRIKAAKKRIVYQSMENSWPLGTDVTLLRTFYNTGVRMVGVAHFQNNQFGDFGRIPKASCGTG